MTSLAYETPAPLPAAVIAKYRRTVTLYVNGKRYELADVHPSTTLLEWLRSIGLTGTKLGCGEGGCGACSVMLSTQVVGSSEIRHAAVNACLMPLHAADWTAVTTVEGIGSVRSGLHPVQERMTAMHGSQCGFCTPGIVVALYSLFRADPEIHTEKLVEHLDGNLCRCTGYRPILTACHTFASEGVPGDSTNIAKYTKSESFTAYDKTAEKPTPALAPAAAWVGTFGGIAWSRPTSMAGAALA